MGCYGDFAGTPPFAIRVFSTETFYARATLFIIHSPPAGVAYGVAPSGGRVGTKNGFSTPAGRRPVGPISGAHTLSRRCVSPNKESMSKLNCPLPPRSRHLRACSGLLIANSSRPYVVIIILFYECVHWRRSFIVIDCARADRKQQRSARARHTTWLCIYIYRCSPPHYRLAVYTIGTPQV